MKTLTNNKTWETWFFKRGKFQLFTGGWVICCWLPKKDAQDEVKIVCRSATLWKTGIFLRGRVELFARGWVSCCWVPKRDDAENEKSNYKTDEGNRKGKYKHFIYLYKKVFHSLVKTCKDSCKHLIMGRVPCSDEFFITRLISKKRKESNKERKVLFPLLVRFTF